MRRWVLAWLLAGTCVLAVGSALAARPGTPGIEARRMVRGEVTRVNEVRGTMTLKTGEGDVELVLPPGAVKGIRKGDRLTVRLAVRASAGARPAAPGRSAAGAKAP